MSEWQTAEYLKKCLIIKCCSQKQIRTLYSTKKNGKAHWEIYNENIVYDNSSHAIDYEVEDAENSTELFKNTTI